MGFQHFLTKFNKIKQTTVLNIEYPKNKNFFKDLSNSISFLHGYIKGQFLQTISIFNCLFVICKWEMVNGYWLMGNG